MLDHVTRRRIAVIAMASVLAVSLVSIVDAVRSRTAIPPYFEVSGFSMAPTLMGPTEIMRCPNCAFEGRFPIDRINVDGESGGCRCPQCGNELDATGEFLDADQVKSNNHSQSIKRGDLVAIAETDPNRKEQNVVKRVVGLPGDTIDLVGTQITINGVLVHDLGPQRGAAICAAHRHGVSRNRAGEITLDDRERLAGLSPRQCLSRIDAQSGA